MGEGEKDLVTKRLRDEETGNGKFEVITPHALCRTLYAYLNRSWNSGLFFIIEALFG